MVSLAPGRLNTFGLAGDHSLVWKYGYGPSWTGWHGNGPKKYLYEPITVSRVLNEISLFMVAEDGTLQHSNFDLVNYGDLGAWKNLGGKLLGPPCVAKRRAGIIHIFHIGSDRAIHHKVWDGAAYSPADEFEKLDGEFTHSPTAVSTGRHDVSVFGIGLDNRLYHYQWKASTRWGPVEKLPGHWTGSPKAVSDQVGFIDVFGIDAGGNITHVFCRNGKDWSLETLPGSFQSIDAISLKAGCIDIFALSEGKTIFHRTLKDDSWLEWEDLKGIMNKPPTAVSDVPEALGVLCVGEGGVVFHKYRDQKTSAWSAWIPIEGLIISRMG